MTAHTVSPQQALFEGSMTPRFLPVCDHYAGVEVRMRKSLQLQAEMGPVFDITLDLEDGAPVGQELSHCQLIHDVLCSLDNQHGRVAVRVHPVNHPLFQAELDALLSRHAQWPAPLAFIMVPKPRHLADAQQACLAIAATCERHGYPHPLPVHVLIETHGALHDAFEIAALPAIESLSFGLMDFVSDHHGAIGADALTAQGQFDHPLIRRAKTRIAAAAHAHGKVPSHCVVTELNQPERLKQAVGRARNEFAYTRMWSIHPHQIPIILSVFSPSEHDVQVACDILQAAQQASWGPIRFQDTLHDRASYRYYWSVLQRAQRTGVKLPPAAQPLFT